MSYTTIWLHCVWSTKNRDHVITSNFRSVLLSHFREQAKKKNIFLDFINAHEDHVHALINLGKRQNIADIMHQLKGESSYWINKVDVMPFKFQWQDDYFAISVSPSHVERVRKYIQNQDKHHREITWEQESEIFIKKYGFEKIKG